MLKYEETERPNFKTLRDLLVGGGQIENKAISQSTLGKKQFKKPVDHLNAALQEKKSHLAADLVRNLVENHEPLNPLMYAGREMSEEITTRVLAEIDLLRRNRCVICEKPGSDITFNCCQKMLLHLKCLNTETAPPSLRCRECSQVAYSCVICKEYSYSIGKLDCVHYLCSKCKIKTRTCPICPQRVLPEFSMYLLFSVCPNIECNSYNRWQSYTKFQCQTCNNHYCPCCKDARHNESCVDICKQGTLKCFQCKNSGKWIAKSMFYTCNGCTERCRVCYNDMGVNHEVCEYWFKTNK